MDWPFSPPIPDPLITITPYSACSLGAVQTAAPASAVFPSANLAVFFPFRISRLWIARKMFAVNGAAVSGNIDVGIYNGDGVRLVSIGSTTQAGTNALQEFDITDTPLGPGLYYLAVAMDNATGALFRSPQTIAVLAGQGVVQQAAGFPLPANATFARAANVGNQLLIGACSRVVI